MNGSKFRDPHRSIEFFQWRITGLAFSKLTNVWLRTSHFTSGTRPRLGGHYLNWVKYRLVHAGCILPAENDIRPLGQLLYSCRCDVNGWSNVLNCHTTDMIYRPNEPHLEHVLYYLPTSAHTWLISLLYCCRRDRRSECVKLYRICIICCFYVFMCEYYLRSQLFLRISYWFRFCIVVVVIDDLNVLSCTGFTLFVVCMCFCVSIIYVLCYVLRICHWFRCCVVLTIRIDPEIGLG